MVEKFDIKNRKIPLTVSITGTNGIREFNFILDTGASVSVFNLRLLESIGYSRKDYFKSENLKGFGGSRIKADLLKVKSAKSLGLKRNNFIIGVIDFGYTTYYDGILGVDFFLNHKLCIDFKKHEIELI